MDNINTARIQTDNPSPNMRLGVVYSKEISKGRFFERMDYGSARIRIGEQVWSLLELNPLVFNPSDDVMETALHSRFSREWFHAAFCPMPAMKHAFNRKRSILDSYVDGTLKIHIQVVGHSTVDSVKHGLNRSHVKYGIMLSSDSANAQSRQTMYMSEIAMHSSFREGQSAVLVPIDDDREPLQGMSVTAIPSSVRLTRQEQSFGVGIDNTKVGLDPRVIFNSNATSSAVVDVRDSTCQQLRVKARIAGVMQNNRELNSLSSFVQPLINAHPFWVSDRLTNKTPGYVIKGLSTVVNDITYRAAQPVARRLDVYPTDKFAIRLGFCDPETCGIRLFVGPHFGIDSVKAFTCPN